nr:MAG TPA: hypothetical protein [Caudoviricetes sp.]
MRFSETTNNSIPHLSNVKKIHIALFLCHERG